MTRRTVWLLAALCWLSSDAAAQSALPKVVREGDQLKVRPMTAAERGQLGDPLFLLALKEKPGEARLDEIEKLIMGTQGRRHLFVVDEEIQSSAPGGRRRAVIAFSGANKNQQLDPNVMLSIQFTDQGVVPGLIEAWGWDDGRSRYNYYKLDRLQGESAATWKFRGSSVDADKLTDRRGTCMACHVNGGPVMKELVIPWNNWHSSRAPIANLSPATPGHWAIAKTARFRDLKGAEDLETEFLLPAIRQFDSRRAGALLRRNASGQPVTLAGLREVVDGPRLLRPLFQTSEYNIASAEQLSGLHPLSPPGATAGDVIAVPATFFLNANLFAGGGFQQYEGLGIPDARQFAAVLRLPPAEYRAVVERFRTKLGDLPGDANFAWFVPEASHIDNAFVDILIRNGMITRELAAAALAIDVEAPVFSADRERLIRFVPPTFRFKPRQAGDLPAAHPDALTKAVIANLEAAHPAAGSAEAEFLAILKMPKPLDSLRQKVSAYLDRTRTRLGDAAQRDGEITRLYQVVLDRRTAATARNPTLVESPRLFPTGQTP